MKITFFAPAPENRGVFWRAFFLGEYLKKMGHDVKIICNNSQAGMTVKKKERDGITIVMLPTSFNIKKWIAMQPYIIFLTIIECINDKSDIFHVFGTMSPSTLAVTATKKILGRQKKLFVDWDDWWWSNNDGVLKDYNIIFRKVGQFFEEASPKIGDHVTVVSDALWERAVKIGIKNISKIENGANIDGIKAIDKAKARRILNLPQNVKIICHLGFTDMVDAFEVVKNKHKDALLLIVGQKPAYAHLRIKNLKELDGIIYTDKKELSEVPLYLSASDVTCINMDNEITETARWPIRFGDYIAAGKPVVCGNIGEIGRIVNEEKIGLTYKPGDKIDFGKKLINALDKKFDYKKIREVAEIYSWSNIAKKLDELYRNAK